MSSHADIEHDISPDSGHRELSTDSLSTSGNAQSEASWHSALAASTTYHHELVGRLRDTMLSTPTITSHHADSVAQSSVSDTSNLMRLGSPLRQPPSGTTDLRGRVLRNCAVPGGELVSPDDGRSSLDKSVLLDDAQLFVNEDSFTEHQGNKSILNDSRDTAGHCTADISTSRR